METPSGPEVTTIEQLRCHQDSRGSLFEPLNDTELADQKNVHVVLTQPKGVRGNHYHQTAVEVSSVVGPCRVRLKESGAIRDIEIPAGEIWRLTIPPRVVHAYENTGDAVMVLVSFSTQLHDPTGLDTIREQIL